MKYLNKYSLIKEGIVEKHFELGSSLIQTIKKQNPIIDDIYDIMIEIMDVTGIIVPFYMLYIEDSKEGVEIITSDFWEYFGMSEADYDNLEEDYTNLISCIDKLRKNTTSIDIECSYQFANVSNQFKALEIDVDIKSILDEAEIRLRSIGCDVKYEYDSSPNNGLWKIDITTPIKIKLDNSLNKLDGIPDRGIKDFKKFINDYKIDTTGENILSNIIRSIKSEKIKDI